MSNTDTIIDHSSTSTAVRANRRSGILAGMFLLLVGVIALAKSFQFPVPEWLFNWNTFLIALGIFIGIRKDFHGGAWMIVLLIGIISWADDYLFLNGMDEHLWPLVMIAVGLFVIMRPRSRRRKNKHETASADRTRDNFADITMFFGQTKKSLVTNNFSGADITSIFGGTELDLSRADFEGTAVIDVTAIFGGTELIIPADWTIQSDVVSLFGAVKDKRPLTTTTCNPGKMLILDGTAIFGGIEIRSF